MTRDDIIRMAGEIAIQCCNRTPSWRYDYAMSRIMELLDASSAIEREECAKVCLSRDTGDMTREDMESRRCAAAIRAAAEIGKLKETK